MSKEKLLTKEDVFKAKDLIIEKMDLPEWGGYLFIRVISGRERDQFEKSVQNKKGEIEFTNFRSRFAALVLCDDEGNRIFQEVDIAELSKKSSAALDRILDKGMKINGMKQEDVEDLVKNSSKGQSDDSTLS